MDETSDVAMFDIIVEGTGTTAGSSDPSVSTLVTIAMCKLCKSKLPNMNRDLELHKRECVALQPEREGRNADGGGVKDAEVEGNNLVEVEHKGVEHMSNNDDIYGENPILDDLIEGDEGGQMLDPIPPLSVPVQGIPPIDQLPESVGMDSAQTLVSKTIATSTQASVQSKLRKDAVRSAISKEFVHYDVDSGLGDCRFCHKTFHKQGWSSHNRSCPERQKAMQEENAESPLTITAKKDKRKVSVVADDELENAKETLNGSPLADIQNSDPAFPRRSKRHKTDVKSVETTGSKMLQYDYVTLANHMKRLRCKYCGGEFADRKNVASQHATECKVYLDRQQEERMLDAALDGQGKKSLKAKSNLMRDLGEAWVARASNNNAKDVVILPKSKTNPNPIKMDHVTALSWLYGSSSNAELMKRHYHRSPLIVHADVTRFLSLISRGLYSLNVEQLLEQSDHSAISILIQSREGTTALPISSPSQALTLFQSGISLTVVPSEIVRRAIIPPLASDLELGAFVSEQSHEIRIVIAHPGQVVAWQMQRFDSIILFLDGTSRWALQKDDNVAYPVRPFSQLLPKAEESLKAQRIMVQDLVSAIAPPVETMDDNDGDDNDGDDNTHKVARPGSVLYVPAGTWYKANAFENSKWLEISMNATSEGDLLVEAVRHLVWTESAWREPLRITSGALINIKNVRQHGERSLDRLVEQIRKLKPMDLVPELMLMNFDDAPYNEVIQPGSGFVSRHYDFDLTSRAHSQVGKWIKISQGSMFRVNPLAVLITMNELSHAPLRSDSEESVKSDLPKKALNRKSKLRPASATPHEDRVYILHVLCGNEHLHSRLRVEFKCDLRQSAIVEWIRHGRNEVADSPFHLSDLLEAVRNNKSKQKQSGATVAANTDEDVFKLMLRFLCGAGYITIIKIPL